jgi:hypothetical protein
VSDTDDMVVLRARGLRKHYGQGEGLVRASTGRPRRRRRRVARGPAVVPPAASERPPSTSCGSSRTCIRPARHWSSSPMTSASRGTIRLRASPTAPRTSRSSGPHPGRLEAGDRGALHGTAPSSRPRPRRLCRRRQRRIPVSVSFAAGGCGTRSTRAPSGALLPSRSPTAAGSLPAARPRRVRSRAVAPRRGGRGGADLREARRSGGLHRGLLSRFESQGDRPGVIAASRTPRAPETGRSARIAGTRAGARRRVRGQPMRFGARWCQYR